MFIERQWSDLSSSKTWSEGGRRYSFLRASIKMSDSWSTQFNFGRNLVSSLCTLYMMVMVMMIVFNVLDCGCYPPMFIVCKWQINVVNLKIEIRTMFCKKKLQNSSWQNSILQSTFLFVCVANQRLNKLSGLPFQNWTSQPGLPGERDPVLINHVALLNICAVIDKSMT